MRFTDNKRAAAVEHALQQEPLAATPLMDTIDVRQHGVYHIGMFGKRAGFQNISGTLRMEYHIVFFFVHYDIEYTLNVFSVQYVAYLLLQKE